MPNLPKTHRPPHGRDRSGYDADRSRALPWRAWYGTVRWKKRRAHQLLIEPDCRTCAADGTLTEATVADHVQPHRGDPTLFWEGELQSLCDTCHSSAKQREERAADAARHSRMAR